MMCATGHIMNRPGFLPIVAVAAIAMGLPAWPQAGGLKGRVSNAVGEPLPNVAIKLTQIKSKETQTATSNASGEFDFPAAAPGLYDVTADAPGSQPFSRHTVEVTAGASRLDIDFIEMHPRDLEKLKADAAADPKDFATQILLGRELLNRGDLAGASASFEKALQLKPESPPALVGLAITWGRRGDGASLLRYTEEALKAQPFNGMAKVLRGVMLERMGKSDDARSILIEALRENANNPDILIEIGAHDLGLKHYGDAEERFRRAYVLDPHNLRALLGIEQMYISNNQPEKASEFVAAEVAKEPQRRDLRHELANLHLRSRQFDLAVTEYQALIDEPGASAAEQANLYAMLAAAYEGKNDFPKAIELLNKADQLKPGSPDYVRHLALLYDRVGDKKQAIASYRAVLKLAPQDPLTLNNLAFMLADTGGNLDEALEMAQLARREVPNSIDILDTLGWIYFKKDLPDSAARIFADLVEKAPKNPSYHYHYGIALARKGDRTAAQNELKLALENTQDKQMEAKIREVMDKLSKLE